LYRNRGSELNKMKRKGEKRKGKKRRGEKKES
jgi:hypothetical protein